MKISFYLLLVFVFCIQSYTECRRFRSRINSFGSISTRASTNSFVSSKRIRTQSIVNKIISPNYTPQKTSMQGIGTGLIAGAIGGASAIGVVSAIKSSSAIESNDVVTQATTTIEPETEADIIGAVVEDALSTLDQFSERTKNKKVHKKRKYCICDCEEGKVQKKSRSEMLDEALDLLENALDILEELDVQEEICSLTPEDLWQRFKQLACYEIPSNCTEQLDQQQSFQEISEVFLQQPEQEPVQQLSYQTSQQPNTIEHITQKTSTAIIAEGFPIQQSGTPKVFPISFWSIIATASFPLCSKFLIS